jgi:hypothetical protein
MKINNFKNALENVEKKEFSIDHVVDEPVKKVKWIKLFPIEEHGSILGIDENGHWVINIGRGLLKLVDGENFLGLLPILEKSKIEFVAKLKLAFESKNLPREIVLSFPFQKLLLFALSTCSAYWKDSALMWIEQSQEMITDEVIDCLNSIVKNKSWPQDLRHRAKSILKK